MAMTLTIMTTRTAGIRMPRGSFTKVHSLTEPPVGSSLSPQRASTTSNRVTFSAGSSDSDMFLDNPELLDYTHGSQMENSLIGLSCKNLRAFLFSSLRSVVTNSLSAHLHGEVGSFNFSHNN